jgi:predicted ATPase
MLITRTHLHNYKSFRESPDLSFGPGFNVVVGPNNAGKTALLEGLSLTFGAAPHRSPVTIPRPGSPPSPFSSADLSIDIPKAEFLQLLADHAQPEFYVSHPDGTTVQDAARQFLTRLPDPVVIEATYNPNQGGITMASSSAWPVPDTSNLAFALRVSPSGTEPQLADANPRNIDRANRIFRVVANLVRNRLYLFRAERMNIGEAQIGTDPTLAPNAQNLPTVLHLLLSRNPPRFARYLRFVNAVFPEIRQITVPPVGATARILLWSTDPEGEREDLAISLAESGTGISQVLAILYVVLTADHPRVFLIDEPQSFLHPAALRTLMTILAAHPQHQYIVSTHSPLVLTATNPSSVLLLRKDGPETTARNIDPREASDLRAVLAEVGARLSDVFGADNVLWVEGLTEELCFPLIWEIARTEEERFTATVMLGVKHTSDFQRRDARAAIELYRRLTAGGALLPPAVGFIFDREGRPPKEQDDLARESRGLVRFLPRRMFENYLVAPSALAAVMNAIDGFRPQTVTAEEIERWLEEHKWDHEYFGRKVELESREGALWLRDVDGARLLETLFRDLSEGRVAYDKVRHGVRLTEWICPREPATFGDIVSLIREAMTRAQ